MIDVFIEFYEVLLHIKQIFIVRPGDGRTDALFCCVSKNTQVPMKRETVATHYANIGINSGNEFSTSHSSKQR